MEVSEFLLKEFGTTIKRSNYLTNWMKKDLVKWDIKEIGELMIYTKDCIRDLQGRRDKVAKSLIDLAEKIHTRSSEVYADMQYEKLKKEKQCQKN